ncbi:MAG: PilZ domain-containing protein [Deltaproteobacteria bacterium]|nr:PilZ domain-containing protein [Deltaproteobacteria bacterium]
MLKAMTAPTKLALPPMFVPANIEFTLNGKAYAFAKEGVSLFGTAGLITPDFSPIDLVGEVVAVTINVLTFPPLRISTPAQLTAQLTTEKEYIGLKFRLSDSDRERMNEAIRREGFYPTSYIRKYPRIPARESIPYVPIRAVVLTPGEEVTVFDVANISPNGILLYSENFKSNLFPPGSDILIQVEPRGQMFEAFDVEGIVRRVVMDKNNKSGLITRYLGVRFTRILDEGEENFRAILHAVLTAIQESNQ